ncbi:brachyurin-like [Phlebotomus papatasi]|uniref:brachyurin-like n=1 Tax=Phlebotomus papatasi TaxID=29031 RepID=UPI0024843FF3|nr:brachyurin-like [Phlebotomus papatasi]
MKFFGCILVAAGSLVLTDFVASSPVKSMLDFKREHPTFLNSTGRIINGITATNGQFPYQARIILTSGSNQGICGGSIISTAWVLIAAHCTVSVSSYRVEAGFFTANSEAEQSSPVSSSNVFVHDGFNGETLANDIALLKLDNPFTISALVGTISLVAQGTDMSQFLGDPVTVSGFGVTSDRQTASLSEVLLYTSDTLLITSSQCLSEYGREPIPIETSFCIYDSTSSISGFCSGDSGGPCTLSISGATTLAGVISYVSNRGCDDRPQGCTDLSKLRSWVDQKMAENP